MRILVAGDTASMARTAARLIAEAVEARPDLRVAWCTGRTVIPVYDELRALYRSGRLSFARVRCFNLDEYWGLPAGHPASFRRFLLDHLLEQVGARPENTRLLDGSPGNWRKECRDFEAAVAAAGGIDLLLDGIGANGHLGFNEPGTSFDSRTCLVDLTEETRQGQLPFFRSLSEVPRQALTRGISEIMRARSVIIMASGSSKAAPLGRALLGPVAEDVPSSVLQRHPDATLVVDAEAAGPFLGDSGLARYAVQLLDAGRTSNG